MGVGVGINLGGNQRSGDEVATELRVAIKPRGDVNALWEGRARFTASANSEYADRSRAASRLADALFSGFPGRSGETIEIE